MDNAIHATPAGPCVHYQRRRPEQTTLYWLVQEHVESFFVQVESETGTGLPEFVKEEFEAFLECGILANGVLRLRCADCAHEKLVAPVSGADFAPPVAPRRMTETAAHLVDHVIPRVPARGKLHSTWFFSSSRPLKQTVAFCT